MMKKSSIALLAALTPAPALRADRGMWLPALIGTRDQRHAFERVPPFRPRRFTASTRSSPKDAVVLFNGGCTGELVSGEGLLLTNHHCGYGAIQSHSSVRHDYLTDGFWAMNRSEEIAQPRPVRVVSGPHGGRDRAGARRGAGRSARGAPRLADPAQCGPGGRRGGSGGPTAGPMSSRSFTAISISCSYTATTPTSVSWQLRLRRSASSAARPTIGCGRAIRATFRCSASYAGPDNAPADYSNR